MPVLGEGANISNCSIMRRPTIHNEWNGAVSRYPLTVVFACDMDMRTGCLAAFARRVPNWVTGFNQRSLAYFIVGSHVQIKNIPAGMFVTVTVQIKYDQSGFGADDFAVCDGNGVVGGRCAAGNGRSKVHCCQGIAGAPS